MAEDDAIAIAQPVVKVDGSCGAIGGKIGGDVVDTNGHDISFGWDVKIRGLEVFSSLKV
jgi:hypothetical protein